MQKDGMSTTSTEAASSALPPATGSSNINVGMTERVLSVVGGATAAVYGFRNLNSPRGISMAIGGVYLLIRGFSGYCAVNELLHRNGLSKRASAMELTGDFTINKPRAEVYAFWRKLENLPRFMKHLSEVHEHDGTRSTWKAAVPGGIGTVSWEAEITEDIPGETLAWSSMPGSTIDNAGEVKFKDAASGAGTEISICMTYRLPAGDLGGVAGKLFNPVVESMIRADLERFKEVIESGETADTETTSSSHPKSKKRRKSEGPNF